MLYTTYYNAYNKCLIISSAQQSVSFQKENGDIYFYDKDNNIIGANIFITLQHQGGLIDLDTLDDPRLNQFKNHEASFKYGLITSYEKHPESDHLNICQIDDGSIKQIVCGASNVTTNKLAIVAQIGAIMPNGMIIAPSQLIKVDSCGMLCSLYELGKSEDRNGIYLSDDLSQKGNGFY